MSNISLFKQRLKGLRKNHNMTQQGLANQLGIVRTAIANYETGRTSPDPETLSLIASIFDVSVDYLLGRTDIKEPIQNIDKTSFFPVIEEFEGYNIKNKNIVNIDDIENLSFENKARIADYVRILKMLEDKNLNQKK